jgi:hypothetical protein
MKHWRNDMSYSNTDITKKSHPKEWALIMLACPGYRKRSAILTETDNVELNGRYWDGGSMSNYWILSGVDGPSVSVDAVGRRNDYPFTGPEREVDLTTGTQVVQCGVFCGRSGYAYLYRKPEEEHATPETTQKVS